MSRTIIGEAAAAGAAIAARGRAWIARFAAPAPRPPPPLGSWPICPPAPPGPGVGLSFPPKRAEAGATLEAIGRLERQNGKLELITRLLQYMQQPRTHYEVVAWLDRAAHE